MRIGKGTPKYVIYYRVSTKRQGRSGLGLRGQKNAVLAFLNGSKSRIVAEYTEIESGKRDDRPQFLKAVKSAQENDATLLVAKLDRLSRDLHFVTGLQKEGIDFTACDMPDANRLTINIMAAMAQQEREMISERTKTALSAAKAKGRKLGASNRKIKKALRAGGWKNSIKTRRERALRFAENLRPKIEKLRIKEGKSRGEIVEHFNDYSVPAPMGGGWSPSQLRRVMDRLGIG